MALPESAAGTMDASERHRRFREVFEAEFDYVWATLRRLGVDARELEDVAQDVFVSVYRRLDSYDRARPLRPWLFAFAFRCAADWRRLARHRIEVLTDCEKRPSASPAADDVVAHAEERVLVQHALDAVPVARRAVLVLHDFDEVPMKQIARALSIPLFTTYSRLRVARREFGEAVRRLRAERGLR
ncbi:MAG TPA: RNA polymerase sigma factor [Polyangiaceae bacterium]|jgi:RNA polymerase sigma-70 factor (ECF subfamily)